MIFIKKNFNILSKKGNYFIIKVPAKKDYNVIASKDGYKTVIIKDVEVKNMGSTKLDFNLASAAVKNDDE